ncbi:MAG: cell division protein CrgA [Actinomycetota bacterium]
MPRSRTRQKRTRPYAAPPPKKRPKPSPAWYGYLVLGLILSGVAVIVWNYMRGDSAENLWLWTGLGVIAVGFVAATRWR